MEAKAGRQAAEGEHRNTEQEHRDGVRKAKAQLGFRLAGSIKDNKSFYHCLGSRRLDKENVGLWLNGAGDLLTVSIGKAEGLTDLQTRFRKQNHQS